MPGVQGAVCVGTTPDSYATGVEDIDAYSIKQQHFCVVKGRKRGKSEKGIVR